MSTIYPPRIACSLFAALGWLLVTGCKKQVEETAPTPVLTTSATSYAVTAAQATQAAENIALLPAVKARRPDTKLSGTAQRVFDRQLQVLNTTSVPAADGQPGMFFCNYVGGGFAIIAADQHMLPVLAFNESGSLPTGQLAGTRAVSEGMASWLETTRQAAVALRQSPNRNSAAIGAAAEWDLLTKISAYTTSSTTMTRDAPAGGATNRPAPDPTPPPCYSVQVGPLLQTTWGQGCGYNAYVTSSNESSYCYHCPTGCVATATAQLMYYWKSPAYFDWANMPVNYGTSATARLLDDLGGKLHMNYKSYADGGSGTDDDYIDDALRGNYGYSSAEYISNQTGMVQAVKGNLQSSMPVIVAGASSTNWFGY